MNLLPFQKSSCFPLFLAADLILAAGCSGNREKQVFPEKPNIIVVMIDNVGYPEFGINGNKLVKTPNLDNFATEGIQFSHFYSTPMSAPTRANIMTGRYHYRTGIIHTSRGGAKMHGDEITIAEMLKEQGYVTGIFGKWHLGDNYPMRPQDQGFDETLVHRSGRLGQVPDFPNSYIDPKLWENGKYVQKQGYCTDIFFSAAIDFIEQQKNKPFFIYLPSNIAHSSSEVRTEVPEEYSKPYLDQGLKYRIATALGMLNNFDENFGRLIAKLDELKLRKNTLVIFLSDDGNVLINPTGLRGRGYSSTYQGSIHVPCFVQWPGQLKGGITIDKMAHHIDILPTILDITKIDKKPGHIIDGVSLLPLLKGDFNNWPDRKLFLQCTRGIKPSRYNNSAVITERYKLIGNPGTFENPGGPDSMKEPVFELYDLIEDPNETTDLADKYPEILEMLRSEYDKWFDDMKNTRQFAPGVIHIGSDKENPTYLSRYQDATYVDKTPSGWPVFIEKEGKYEVKINRGDSLGKGKLCVELNSVLLQQTLNEGEDMAFFNLPTGEFFINIYVKDEGKEYIPRAEEDLIGDVIIRHLTE